MTEPVVRTESLGGSPIVIAQLALSSATARGVAPGGSAITIFVRSGRGFPRSNRFDMHEYAASAYSSRRVLCVGFRIL